MSEASLLEGLSSLSISPSDHTPLTTLPVHGDEAKTFTVDVRNESVIVSGRSPDHLILSLPLPSLAIVYQRFAERPSLSGLAKVTQGGGCVYHCIAGYYALRRSRTRDTVKLTVCVCVSVPAVTVQRLQCDDEN